MVIHNFFDWVLEGGGGIFIKKFIGNNKNNAKFFTKLLWIIAFEF